MALRKLLFQLGGLFQELGSGDKLLLPASVAGSAPLGIPQGTAPTTPSDGDLWTTAAGVFTRINGATIKLNGSGLYYSSNAAVVVANTTTTSPLLLTALNTGAQTPGNVVNIVGDGTLRFVALGNVLTVTLLIGSTTLGTFTIAGTEIDGAVVNTDYHWRLEGNLSPQTGPGASSNIGFYGKFVVVGATLNTEIDIAVIGTGINTTVSNNLTVNVAWSAANANNSITANYMLAQQINSIGGNGGAVMSVALSVPALFTASGSPITSSGTLGFAWNGSGANLVRDDGSTVAQSTFLTAVPSSVPGQTTFNKLKATSFGVGYQAIATAAGTTTLTAASPNNTEFTGTLAQTCVLPDATTMLVGDRFQLDNNSTGLVTVNANGGGAVVILATGTSALFTCKDISTAAGVWEMDYTGIVTASGKKLTVSNTLTLTGTDGTSHALPGSNSTLARTDTAQSFNGVQTFLGNVTFGSGTMSFIPATMLNLLSSVAGAVKTLLNIVNTGGGAGAGAAIDFFTYDVSGGTAPGARIVALDGNFSADLVFLTKAPGAAANALVERMRITNAGVGTLPGGLTCSAGGIGYATGAGGTVTQATSRTTGVTLSKLSGTITLFTTTLAAVTSQAFVLTNTFIAATDQVVVTHSSGGTLGLYTIAVTPAAGSCTITIRNNSAAVSPSEAPVLRFVVIKAVVA